MADGLSYFNLYREKNWFHAILFPYIMYECPIGIRFFANKSLFRIRSCTLSVLMSKSSCDVGKTTFF